MNVYEKYQIKDEKISKYFKFLEKIGKNCYDLRNF